MYNYIMSQVPKEEGFTIEVACQLGCMCPHSTHAYTVYTQQYWYIVYVHTYIQYSVYNNHSKDQVMVVSVDRWSLYTKVH